AVFYDVPADELKDDDTPDPEEETNDAEAKKAKRKKFNLIYWIVWAVIYLVVSVATGKWGASWTLLLLAAAIYLIALAFRWVNSTK
ncbi:MAG: XRE family transcriptional regulator, partial [Lactobacillus sp.]